MQDIIQYHEEIGTLMARIFLGSLFLFQGYDAIFGVKVSNVMNTVESSFRSKGVPHLLVLAGVWFTSYIELTGGFLLIIGLFKYIALYLLCIDLLVASIGFGIASAMWDTKHVF